MLDFIKFTKKYDVSTGGGTFPLWMARDNPGTIAVHLFVSRRKNTSARKPNQIIVNPKPSNIVPEMIFCDSCKDVLVAVLHTLDLVNRQL